METVRWGLLSTANINRKLIPAIRASQRGKLAAVASRSQDSAEAYAGRWDIPKTFGSYQAMLDSGEVDCVYISLPNHLHAEWSVRAMQAGVHVLCEKPFALSLQEVDQMIAASQKTGRVLAEAFMYRHHPQMKLVGEWVRSGKLGKIVYVHGAFTYAMKSREDVRLVAKYGGGSLWDVGVYPLSFAQYIYGGPPEVVSAFQWTGDTSVDEDFSGQMRYPGGGLASIHCSFRTPNYTLAEVMGTLGKLTLTRPYYMLEQDRHLTFTPEDGPAQEIPVPEVELYLGEVEDMNAAILDGAPPYLRLEETRNHVRTALALYEAARSGKVVSL